MSINVVFKNEKTGELKKVKVGWSWTLFFFTGTFGLPLFLRRLNVWGAIILVIWTASFLSLLLEPVEEAMMDLFFSLILIGFSIWFAIKGNEMTAKNYLENGWAFAEANSEDTKTGKKEWGIT